MVKQPKLKNDKPNLISGNNGISVMHTTWSTFWWLIVEFVHF